MRILVVEDNEIDFHFIKRGLEAAFENDDLSLEWDPDPRTEHLIKTANDFDVCFIDNNLPQEDGVDIIAALTKAGVKTPLILLTGDGEINLDHKAIAKGAADFIHKDKLSISSISRATRYCIARKEQEQRLREMAYTDPLTGLANRAAFDERCKAALSRLASDGGATTLILLDLDDFKVVNDTYGHPYGDGLLKQFSTELASHFGPSALVARTGGDEFGVIYEDEVRPETPNTIRDRLRAVLRAQFQVFGTKVLSPASIGVTTVTKTDLPVTPTDLVQRADRNLYVDKRRSKFERAHFKNGNGLNGCELEAMVQDLERAISNDELELFYQPKVNYKSRHITGLEALLRWNSPTRTISPDIFIPVAEEFGLIHQIGNWVLRRCCAQINDWIAQGQTPPPIAVNVSPLQLDDANFARVVAATLQEFKIAPERIEFELTEGSLEQAAEVRLVQMAAVAGIGCRWAIDDFGIGYSSLSRIHKLPISRIKVDKSFLDQLPQDRSAQAISNTIISMARCLDLDLVVEGVESPDQLFGLDLGNADELQGFHCYPPMAADTMSQVLNEMRCFAA